MSINKLALEDVEKNPDGKRDDAQPVQVMEDRELELHNLERNGSTVMEPFRFSIEEALELAVMKGGN